MPRLPTDHYLFHQRLLGRCVSSLGDDLGTIAYGKPIEKENAVAHARRESQDHHRGEYETAPFDGKAFGGAASARGAGFSGTMMRISRFPAIGPAFAVVRRGCARL